MDEIVSTACEENSRFPRQIFLASIKMKPADRVEKTTARRRYDYVGLIFAIDDLNDAQN